MINYKWGSEHSWRTIRTNNIRRREHKRRSWWPSLEGTSESTMSAVPISLRSSWLTNADINTNNPVSIYMQTCINLLKSCSVRHGSIISVVWLSHRYNEMIRYSRLSSSTVAIHVIKTPKCMRTLTISPNRLINMVVSLLSYNIICESSNEHT